MLLSCLNIEQGGQFYKTCLNFLCDIQRSPTESLEKPELRELTDH